MKKIYRADWKTYAILFTIGFLFMASPLILEGKDKQNIIVGIVGLFLLLASVVLIIVTRYASISDNILIFVYPPLFKLYPKKVPISKIIEISRQPTFRIFRGSIKSLYIFYVAENGKTKWIEFRPVVFKEETMGKIVRDLKELNPSIKLDLAAQKLMEQAKKS